MEPGSCVDEVFGSVLGLLQVYRLQLIPLLCHSEAQIHHKLPRVLGVFKQPDLWRFHLRMCGCFKICADFFGVQWSRTRHVIAELPVDCFGTHTISMVLDVDIATESCTTN